MTSCDNSPHEVGQDIPVLVLATAVITVQVDLLLPQPIVLKVVVEIGYDGIGPLAATVALINEADVVKVKFPNGSLTFLAQCQRLERYPQNFHKKIFSIGF